LIIDTTTSDVTTTVHVGDIPRGVAVSPDGKKVYVAIQFPGPDSLTGAVNIIDTATNKVTATVPVGKAPGGIEVTPDGTKVYVVNCASHTVSVIDTTTDKVTDTVKVGKYPIEVAFGNFVDSNMTGQSTSGNESSKNNSTPDFSLLGGLTCLYGVWKFRKK
jgi:YVTN family beta-propeller protein